MTTYEAAQTYGHRSVSRSVVGPALAFLLSACVRLWKAGNRFLLPAAGLSCLVVAAFMWTTIAGMVALGIACFVLDYGRRK